MLTELPLLFTTLAYRLVLGVESSFHPIVPGVIFCIAPSDVITSAITPVPGRGSVVSFLVESALLAGILVAVYFRGYVEGIVRSVSDF